MTPRARVAFLGDTLLGGTAGEAIAAHGHAHLLARVAHLWEDADLVVANHEGPLTRGEAPAPKHDTGRKRYWYRGDPESAQVLAGTGVRAVSLANNHVGDFGPQGLRDTLAALDDAGIAHGGAGEDDAGARRPLVVTAGGLRIGLLSRMQRYRMYVQEESYATADRPGPALLRPELLAAEVAELRATSDVVVALPHWGRNYRRRTELQRELARALVAAGVDLVVGHHPHVPHPVRMVSGVPVLYSLGNAVFGSPGRYHSGRAPYGVVALADLEPGRVTGLELRLLHVDNTVVDYQPVPVPPTQAAPFLASLCSTGVRAAYGAGVAG